MTGIGAPRRRLDDALSAFVDVRRRLLGAAYRILGSVTEAEDIVQDVWLRWQTADRSVVRDAPAFLITVTTRLALNRINSGYARREASAGPQLPEPVDPRADSGLRAERGEALELAVLWLLERLSPTERAAYVLREAFSYEYSQIAELLRVSEVNGRQLVARARKHLAVERRAPAAPAAQRRFLEAFIGAAQTGDLGDLERLFAADVVAYADGSCAPHAARAWVVTIVTPR